MLIARFISEGLIKLGQPVDSRQAHEIIGTLPESFRITDRLIPIDKLLAPIIPTDILCIGLNYHAHARETNSTVPDNPMLFIKASNALTDPFAPVVLPSNSQQIDYEAELAIVISKDAKNVSRDRPSTTYWATPAPTTSALATGRSNPNSTADSSAAESRSTPSHPSARTSLPGTWSPTPTPCESAVSSTAKSFKTPTPPT